MATWDKITPALYGIARKTSVRIIQEKWDQWILPVLQNEKTIYECIFSAFVQVKYLNLNAKAGYAICDITLAEKGVTFEDTQIRAGVLDIYWTLAEDKNYWQHESYAEYGKELAYEAFLTKWAEDNPDRIQQCEEDLKQWLNN